MLLTTEPTETTAVTACPSCAATRAASRSKSQFVANMSHELRTPLNAVLGFTSVLMKNKGDVLAPQELAYLNRIKENGNHLLRLINGLLDMSKIESGKMSVTSEDVDLKTFVEGTMAQIAGGAASSAVTLVPSVARGLQPLRTDADKLRQILINLVGNAMKFTSEGTITAWVAPDDEGRPVRLDVIDTGIGIPSDRQAAIFEAFEQADSTTSQIYGGTGLGLAISSSLAKLLGFRLTVASEPGSGATFSIHFQG